MTIQRVNSICFLCKIETLKGDEYKFTNQNAWETHLD